jgi:hypothetical protein
MKNRVALVLCAVGLSGCLTSNVLVTVRPDGSGTVEYTTILRPAALAAFEKLLAPDVAAARPAGPDMADPRRWRAQDRIGREVRLLSAKPIKTAETDGWMLTYEFDDVRALDVDLIPLMPGMQGFYGIAAKERGASTRVRMSLDAIAGGMERLSIRFPRFDMDPGAEPPASWASGTPDDMAALRDVMRGARLTLAVQTDTPLVRTNSPFRDGDRVTLFHADIPQALFSRQIGTLVTTPATFDELLTSFSDLPGVTLAREREITLDFRNPSLLFGAGVTAPPEASLNTDVFLASLSSPDGALVIGPPINVSHSAGYDDHPSFTPDRESLLFSSARRPMVLEKGESRSSPSQVDVYRYDLLARQLSRVTRTPENEYSPQMMPDGNHLSVVRTEESGARRLWQTNRNGSEWSVILPDSMRLGDYTWLDERSAAIYVPGEGVQPSSLEVADSATGKSIVITTEVGRSLQRMPSGGISFIQRERAASDQQPKLIIKRLARTADGQIQIVPLVPPAAGTDDPFVAWTPDGTALMAVDATIYRWRPGERDWTVLANLEPFRLRGITRLAVSPAGDQVALVAHDKGTSIAH